MKNADPTTLTGYYQLWFQRLQGKAPSVAGMDQFNADIQRAIEAPYRDAAVKTELAQLKLKANKWLYNKARTIE